MNVHSCKGVNVSPDDFGKKLWGDMYFNSKTLVHTYSQSAIQYLNF